MPQYLWKFSSCFVLDKDHVEDKASLHEKLKPFQSFIVSTHVIICLSNPIHSNWHDVYWSIFQGLLVRKSRTSNKLRLTICARVHCSTKSSWSHCHKLLLDHWKMLRIWIQLSSNKYLLTCNWCQVGDKCIHADSIEHLQMCHNNGNNGYKEKGERDRVIS